MEENVIINGILSTIQYKNVSIWDADEAKWVVISKPVIIRDIKQLLEIMYNNKDYFYSGLCYWALKLYSSKFMSEEEYELLVEYIKGNRPSATSSMSTYINRNSVYYWGAYDINPRIKWLEEHIAKLGESPSK